MARGTIFKAAINPTDVEVFADDFYDYEDELGVDYVADRSPEDSQIALGGLIDSLSKAGFKVMPNPVPEDERDEDDENCFAFTLETGDAADLTKAKENYFSAMFAKLKEQVAKMALTEFATEVYIATDILNNVENRCGDLVYYDAGTGPASYTLHGFIRRLEPNKTLYFGPHTVYMH